MKKLAFLGGTVGVSLAALLGLHLSQAADHADAPGVMTNPMGDLNDVYAWMTSDAATVNLALTVSPFDDGTRSFGPSVVYAIHATSRPGFGMPGVESKVICKFASNTSGECWVTSPSGSTLEYVKGDFSAAAGVASTSGKIKVFAGRRSDPFFFNLGGFKRAVTTAVTVCGGSCPGNLGSDDAGCPPLDAARALALRTMITTAPPADIAPCGSGQIDCFDSANVMAIVVQVDKTLLLAGDDVLLSVYGSTHTGS